MDLETAINASILVVLFGCAGMTAFALWIRHRDKKAKKRKDQG